jgi:sugar/nucleoside kinase (ribokinase family)
VYDVEEMPQSSQPLPAEGFRMKVGGKGKNQALAVARGGAEVVMVGNEGLAEVGLRDLAAAMDIARVISPPGIAGWTGLSLRDAGQRSSPLPASAAKAAVLPAGNRSELTR